MASDFHTHSCHSGKTELVNDGKACAPLWSLSFHPWNIREVPEPMGEDLQNCAALGELGFDRYRGLLPYPGEQLALCRKLLFLAEQFRKPAVLHAVGSSEYLFQLKKDFPETKMLIHGFSKHNPLLLGQLLDGGFYVSLHPSLIADEKIITFLRSRPGCKAGLETDDDNSLAIEELYAQIDIPGFEKAADAHFREFLQI
jgi:TatD DNase family protein